MVVWDGKIHNLSQPFRTMNHKGLKSIFPPTYDHPPKKLLSQVGHSWLRKRQHQPPTKNQQIQGWINESTRFSSLQRIPQPFKFICEIIGLGLRRCGGGGENHPHTIHVWYIHLHLVDFYGKCTQIYHTWILWDREP